MTNFEKIKAMTVDEMAEFMCMSEQPCMRCAFKGKPCFCADAVEVHKKWLESEARTKGDGK